MTGSLESKDRRKCGLLEMQILRGDEIEGFNYVECENIDPNICLYIGAGEHRYAPVTLNTLTAKDGDLRLSAPSA